MRPVTSRPPRAATPRRTVVAGTTGGDIAVRAAAPDDLETVVSLRLALLREEAARDRSAPPDASAEARAYHVYGAQLACDRETTFLAVHRGRAVGILRCTRATDPSLVRPGPYAVLTSAYVRPTYRHRGVLRALLGRADEWCRARGLPEMRLHAFVENTDGNAAWEALGFAATEVRRRRVVPGP